MPQLQVGGATARWGAHPLCVCVRAARARCTDPLLDGVRLHRARRSVESLLDVERHARELRRVELQICEVRVRGTHLPADVVVQLADALELRRDDYVMREDVLA